MIKLVAFDWNGVIIDDLKAIVKCTNLVLEHYKLPLTTIRGYQKNFDVPIRKFWENSKLDLDFYDKHQDEIHDIFFCHYNPLVEDKCLTRVGTKSLLTWLSKNKIKTLIFSNHHVPGIKKQMKRLGLNGLIDDILGREGLHDKVHMRSRHKETKLINLLKNYKIKPKEIMVIGDTDEEIDIGNRLGYITVALTGGHHSVKRLKASKPNHLIRNLSELKKIIQSI